MRKFITVLLLLPSLSCTRTYMVKTDSTQSVVEQVNVLAVAYHRPSYEPAMHDDFKVKNRNLACQHANEIWSESVRNYSKVNECLNSIQDGNATYFYVPAVQPYLELDIEEEKNPKCLKEVLKQIPLPREIYYLGYKESGSLDRNEQECYSTSFGIDTNQLMKIPTGFLKKKIELPFPLSRSLKTANDLSLWLMVTTFTILMSDEQADGRLWATPVPESVCRQCFKHDALFDDKRSGKIRPVFWP
jgi:hypothetical protein